MDKVSIRFQDGKLTVLDENGVAITTSRATVYLVAGNRYPVALLVVKGENVEYHVTSLDVPGAAGVIGEPAIVSEGDPRKKGGGK